MMTTHNPSIAVSDDVLASVSKSLERAEGDVLALDDEIEIAADRLKSLRARYDAAVAKATNLRQFMKQHAVSEEPANLLEA